MTVEELAKLVVQMRKAQTRYFNTRDRTHLNESKDLERRVDAALAFVLHPQTPTLFGERE